VAIVDQGYDLTFRTPKDVTPVIIEYDEPKFAHVIVLASETKSKQKTFDLYGFQVL